MVGNDDYVEPLRQMDAFIARADKVLGTADPRPVTPPRWRRFSPSWMRWPHRSIRCR